MELLYNPDAMSEQEIKATFVARQPLVDKLIAMIESQPDGAGVQHVVIIAPRGMGKTTVLLMVKFTLKDRGLADRWQAVKFPEESYGIYDLADFWIQTLELLAVETGDDAPRIQAEELKRKYPNNDDLQEAALAAIKDWRRKHGKRLVLLVENFDMILEQINDEQDNARLRDVLMNDGTMMLIGGATTFFKEARAYDQPLYNFFQIENLTDLKFEQMQQLLKSRAQQDARPNFDATLKANAGRLRVLEYFTGGNPRLVLMMYRVVTQSDLSEVRRGLEKLLDEVTPYYKAKIESLPPQQRKILDHIARISGKTSEGLTPAEIAEAVRLSPNQVSAQLKRLSEIGYVRAANMRGRSVPYTLAEPLYAIWHQMRFGRDAHQRMQWLVNFLKSWYDREEMGPESERLATRFRDHLQSSRLSEARDTLEHHRYLAEAMDDASIRTRAMETIMHGHLEIGDTETVRKELLTGIKLEDLSEAMVKKLLESGCISEKQAQIAAKKRPVKNQTTSSIENQKVAELMAQAASAYYHAGYQVEALQYLDKAVEIRPDDADVWGKHGTVLSALGRDEEALSSFDQSLALNPNHHKAWHNRGIALTNLGRYREALANFAKALAINPDDYNYWSNRGVPFFKLNRYEEAITCFDRALSINSNNDALIYSGVTHDHMGNARWAAYNRANVDEPDNHEDWNIRGAKQAALGNYEEAIASYDRAIEISPFYLEITPFYYNAWYYRGQLFLDKFIDLVSQKNIQQSRQEWQEALKSSRQAEGMIWVDVISDTLLEVGRMGHLQLARELISEANLEEELFPLARALDYLQTGDEALIERLSPEVKGIVEEVVDKLRPVAKNTKSAKPKTKR